MRACLQITGDLYAEEPVRVAGHLHGQVVSRESVLVERSGTVQGDVDGRDVIVEGTVEGNVRATRKFELRLTGRVRGDVQAASIAIADGSFLHGKVVALEQEPVRFREKRRHARASHL
ncbi:MAG: polymer-forming cytoskeletal protein [Acidobacteriota bacterium]|nr:polymer-forming cytoskeletal protein [Acidobacteriota bacterium]